MITLYIETNFFIDFAKNQDQETENLVYSQNPEVTTRLKIITPAICCMEALSVLESERNRSNRFGDNLKDEVRKLKGDVNSQYSREIKRCLEQAIIKNNERINEINTRLFDILEWAKNSVELIQLKPDILSASLDNLLITDPTDNLILHCILDHAQTSLNEQKVFFEWKF
ncbi:PIN domain-containing protein [Aphanizomenon flos-aquae]|uniref:PIN domain-containing protein n=1 Tax=Aphanizomenon flos-aquae TaxID=1176 RepID=UPI0013643FD5|nr:PIN domain-containing protein [Aphanizomenon flos-aquae]